MILLIAVFSFFVSIWLLMRNNKFTGWILIFLTQFLIFSSASSLFTNWYIKNTLIENSFASFDVKSLANKKTAIVILGGGSTESLFDGATNNHILAHGRVLKAASLYFECKKQAGSKCVVVASGGDPQGRGQSEAEIIKSQLLSLSIPETDILTESESRNTEENAVRLIPILTDVKANQILLVTSGLHLRRALLWFDHYGISTTPISSDYVAANKRWIPTSYNLSLTDACLHEWLGMIYMQFRIKTRQLF